EIVTRPTSPSTHRSRSWSSARTVEAIARAASPTVRMRRPSRTGADGSIGKIVRVRGRAGVAIVGAMLDRTEVAILVAVATLVLPIAFLAALGVAGVRRQRGRPVS